MSTKAHQRAMTRNLQYQHHLVHISRNTSQYALFVSDKSMVLDQGDNCEFHGKMSYSEKISSDRRSNKLQLVQENINEIGSNKIYSSLG